MEEYVVINMEQTFFVPKTSVDIFLPEFKEGLALFLTEEAKESRPQRRDMAYDIILNKGLKDADVWLATLLVAPLLIYNTEKTEGDLGIGAFTKYYSKQWGFHNEANHREGFEAVLRIIRTFFDTTGLATSETVRIPTNSQQQTNFVLTKRGEEKYSELDIQMADEEHSAPVLPSLDPIEYLSTPWLGSTGSKHLKLQLEETERNLTKQASAASSVGFVIPPTIAKVYLDWFNVQELPEHLQHPKARFIRAREHSKLTGLRRMEISRREVISDVTGKLTYYPVGFDRKARQYMAGYPINPQGAKSDRPLFYVVANALPKEKILADLTMEGRDLFGEHWKTACTLTVSELEDHNDEFIKQVCTTKGELDLNKYTVLLEYAKQKEKS